LWSLAVRTDAEAVFVLGLDDGRAVLDPMADELRLVVRVVPADDVDSWPGDGRVVGTGAAGADSNGMPSAGQGVLPGDRARDVGGLGMVGDGRGSQWWSCWTTER
jgi:hypothetical protein